MQQKIIDLKKIKRTREEEKQKPSFAELSWPQKIRNASVKASPATHQYRKPIRAAAISAPANIALRNAPQIFKPIPRAQKQIAAHPQKQELPKAQTAFAEKEKVIAQPAPYPSSQPLLSWQATEHQNEIPSADAKLLLGIGAIALLAYSLYAQNYLFAIVILLASFVWYGYSHRQSRVIHFSVTSRGVTVENRLYEFQDLQSFWIFYDPPRIKELSVKSGKTLMPFLKMPLGETSPTKLRETLVKFIPEKKQEETLTEILSRRFGL